MTYLLMQTFMLLLASYFLGAMTACLIKRAVRRERTTVPVGALADQTVADGSGLPQHVYYEEVSPRQFELVQPKIEIIERPDPYPPPKVADISRFDRALSGPDLNENMPRVAIVEIRPTVLERPTGDEGIFDPSAQPEPVPPEPAEEDVALSYDDVAASADQTSGSADEADSGIVEDQGYTPGHVGFAGASAAAAAMGSSFSIAETNGEELDDENAEEDGALEQPSEATATETAEDAGEAEEPEVVESAAPDESAEEQLVSSDEDDDSEVSSEHDLEEDHDDLSVSDADVQSHESLDDEDAYPESDVVDEDDRTDAVAPAVSESITDGDDLQRIRAIDAETELLLKQNGYLRFGDIASWTPEDIDLVDAALDLDGRIDSEQWVEQAQILAKGGETYYSRNRAASVRSHVAMTSDEETDGEHEEHEEFDVDDSSDVVDPEEEQPEASSDDRPKSVSEVAAAAAAAIAAASASVTRGIRPIEPISPLSKVDPNIRIPARLQDAIRERGQAEEEPDKGDETPIATPSGQANDLKRIRGIGVLIAKRLNALGIDSYEQIANWTRSDIDRVSQKLEFSGRIERENWVEQARILVGGGDTEFSRRVDRGEVDSSKE